MIKIWRWTVPFVSSDSLYGLMSDDPELLLSTGRWFSFKEPSEDPTDPTVSDKWRSRYKIDIHVNSVQSQLVYILYKAWPEHINLLRFLSVLPAY